MIYQNIFDQDDLWEVDSRDPTKFVDGIEFVLVKKPGTQRKLLMKKDALKPSQKPWENRASATTSFHNLLRRCAPMGLHPI